MWAGDPGALTHVLDSGNHTYRLPRQRGPDLALRLTATDYRTQLQIEAEIALHQHLAIKGVRVPEPIRSRRGRFTERLPQPGSPEDAWPTACAFAWLPGRHVSARTDDPAFDRAFVTAWGAALGEVHTATTDTPALGFVRRGRWHWRTEGWIADDALFAREPEAIRQERALVLDELDRWPETLAGFGVIHGDLGPRNLLWEPAEERATAIDFANCCLHFRAMDLVIARSAFGRLPAGLRDQASAWLLDGYRSRAHLDLETYEHQAPWLRRARRVYVLGSRLWKFGPTPTPEQAAVIARLRDGVLRAPR